MRYQIRNKTGKATVASLFWLIVIAWLLGIAGWMINLFAIFNADFSVWTGQLVMRVIGVFIPPIGAVMGLFI